MRYWLTIAALLVAAVAQGQFSTTLKTVLSGDNPILFRYSAGDSLAAATFTRASTATYHDVAGVLRFAPHNYVTYSQDFSNAAWVVAGVTKGSAVTDPNGGTDAKELIFDAGTNGIHNTTAVVEPAAYTFSVWVRCGSGTLQFRLNIGDSVNNLSGDLTATTTWQRFEFTVSTASTTARFVQIVSPVSGAAITIHAFGAQLERNTAASDYLATTTAARYDVARDNHYALDPVSGLYKRSLLLEGQRTNLALRSQEFDDAAWTKAISTITANSTVAPDGTTTADTIVATGAFGNAQAAQAKAASPLVYTLTCYYKAGTVSIARLVLTGDVAFTNGATVEFNVTTGAISTAAAAFGAGWTTVSATIEAAANGFFRCSLTATTASTAEIRYAIGHNSAAVNTNTVIAWGAQLEQAAFPSSYIPTTTATVTRAADSLSFPFTAVPQEMTVFARIVDLGTGVTSNGVIFHTGSGAAPRLLLYGTGGQYSLQHFVVGFPASATGTTFAYGDAVETLSELRSTGAIKVTSSKNGAAEVAGALSAVEALGSSWATPTLHVGGSAVGAGFAAFRDIIIAKRERKMAFFRNRINN